MPSPRPRRRRLGALAIVLALLTLAAVVPALAGAVTATIEGSPLRIFVYGGSNLQANLENAPTNVFYSPDDAIGDAGLFFRFHDDIADSGIAAGNVAGPQTRAGITPDIDYTAISQTPVTGTGSAASPFQVVSVYKVADVLEITQTVKYVNGETTFRVSYAVKNLSASAVRFRASHAADLYLDGSDLGTGFLDAGPPRIVGGQSETTGRSGGIQEVTPWSHFQAAEYSQIWSIIHNGTGFDDTVVDSEVDNGVGVEWNDYDTTGLPAGATGTYELVWRFGVAGLGIQPSTATRPVGTSHLVGISAIGPTGQPLGNKTVRYTITGPHAATGTLTTSDAGQATHTWLGTTAGQDVFSAYVDLNGNGIREANEPQGSATVDWVPGAAPPPSDRDGDGVPDAADACPDLLGATGSGCPPATGSLGGGSRSLSSALQRLGVSGLLANGGASFSYTAPAPGQLVGSGTGNVNSRGVATKKVVLLAGKKTFSAAGKGKVKLKLTKAGRKALKRAKKARLTVTLAFTDVGNTKYTKTLKVTLKKKKRGHRH
jgi:hypothetical protein